MRAAAIPSSRDRLAGCFPGACDRTTVSRCRLIDFLFTSHKNAVFQDDFLVAVAGLRFPFTASTNRDRLVRLDLAQIGLSFLRKLAPHDRVAVRFEFDPWLPEPIPVHSFNGA